MAPPTHVLMLSVAYGSVQAALSLPLLYALPSAIFSHPLYGPYLPAITKLVLLSAILHGAHIVARSALPFAVGQVQLSGIVFLAQIASNVAKAARNDGFSDQEALATTLASIAIATMSLGLLLGS